MDKKIYFWVDTETTGLDPQNSALLEIAVIVTDSDLEELSRYHAVVKYSASEVEEMKAACDTVVLQMHEKTGLWDKLSSRSAIDLQRIDEDLSALVPSGSRPYLAGSSVGFDKGFVTAALPNLSANLHHRVLDVSSIAIMAQTMFQVPAMDKRREHSALSDIEESISEYRYLVGALASSRPSATRLMFELTDFLRRNPDLGQRYPDLRVV